jgi:type II secretory pathway component PulF
MLQNGVPLLETLSLSRTGIGNRCFADLLDQLQRDVIAGRGIGQSLAASRYIPGGAAEMVMTGERTGSLGSVMEIVGQFYEEDGEERLREAAKMLEPLIIIVMGAVVAFIVASVMLPMFEFSQGQ